MNEKIVVCFIILLYGFSSLVNAAGPLVVYWKFNEGSGRVAHDVSGNHIDGVLQNGTLWSNDSKEGYALRFDGRSGYASSKTSQVFSFTDAVKVDVWIKRDSHDDGTIIGPGAPYFLGIKDDRVFGGVYVRGWLEVEGVTALATNVWHHLVLTYDGKQLTLFVDEQEESHLPRKGKMEITQGLTRWVGYGFPDHDRYFAGIIDEVKIFNIAHPEAIQEVCDDAVDNNGDTLIDCQATTCQQSKHCLEQEHCDDKLDNDLDGQVDCDDKDCLDFCSGKVAGKVQQLIKENEAVKPVGLGSFFRMIFHWFRCTLLGKCG